MVPSIGVLFQGYYVKLGNTAKLSVSKEKGGRCRKFTRSFRLLSRVLSQRRGEFTAGVRSARKVGTPRADAYKNLFFFFLPSHFRGVHPCLQTHIQANVTAEFLRTHSHFRFSFKSDFFSHQRYSLKAGGVLF